MQEGKPTCLGFIMDGNRRWAREQGLETYEGHRKGMDVFKDSVEWMRNHGIRHAVYYAFSTENWKRSDAEVGYLMAIFRELLKDIHDRMDGNRDDDNKEKPINVRVIGRKEDFDQDIQDEIDRIEKKNEEYPNPVTTIWVALSYGGRAELVDAVNRAVKAGESVTEESFEALLWTANMPDPDMIVRTSGEQRLSNFVTWRSVYSELHFIDKHWPALTEEDFLDILKEYESRQRRHGA